MPIQDVLAFAKTHDLPMTAISTAPYFDTQKGRVAKGPTRANTGWRNNNRWEKKNTVAIFGNVPTAWMMRITKANLFVIDVDVKNGRTARDVLQEEVYQDMMDTCAYAVETGSRGMHFYFKRPPLGEGETFKNSIKCEGMERGFLRADQREHASIDIIVDSVVVEGSSYTFEGETYRYIAAKMGSSIHDIDEAEININFWESVKADCVSGGVVAVLAAAEAETVGEREVALNPAEIVEHVHNIPNARTNWDEWYKMGQLLFNMLGKDAGLPVFMEWSAQNPFYDARATIRLWNGMQDRQSGPRRSKGTLLWLSKTANAAGYEVIRKKYGPLPRSQNMRTKCTSETEYLEMREAFESKYFLCKDTNTICTVSSEGISHMKPNPSLFREYNFQHVIDGKIQVDEFLPIWSRDREARTVNRLSFYPDVTYQKEGELNTFQGLRGATVSSESNEAEAIIARFNELVLANAGDNQEHATYFRKWLASAVQRPWDIPTVAIILVNTDQGTGKDMLLNFIGSKVFGNSYFKNIQNAENELFDTHSIALERTLFMKLEEVDGAMTRKAADRLKSIITSKRTHINPKGVGKYDIDTFPHIVMTSNNVVPVRVEESDRRFCIFYTSSKYKGNFEFWAETVRLFDLPEAGGVIYQYLMGIDINGFRPQDFPCTEYRENLLVNEVPSEALFIRQCEPFTDLKVAQLHPLYRAFCSELGVVPKSGVHFARALAPMIATKVVTRRVLQGANVYSKI